MTPGVARRNGIRVTFADGTEVALDGGGAADAIVVSHAHGDHLVRSADRIVASHLTAALAGVRGDGPPPTPIEHPQIELLPAGHVVGSRAAKLTDPATGRTYLYTGDCCTRDRFYLSGFEPVEADVLIVESTYGTPAYRFPPIEASVAEIHDWLADTMDRVVILFGYALGRAQTLLRILADSPRERVFVTEAVATLNEVIEAHRDVTFPGEPYDRDVALTPGDALLLPTGSPRLGWIQSLVAETDAVTAGFSGWAVDDSFVYRRGYDEGFVLSDHCDFDELVAVVDAVDPEQVYTTHGFDVELADHLATAGGYEARALRRHQATLADF